nr:hypothetical protein [Gemmatimonadaceae bacterium]
MFDACHADLCAVCSAPADLCALVAAARQNDTFTVHAATVELREKAVRVLDACRLHGCDVHRQEDDALALLEERTCTRCLVHVAGELLVRLRRVLPAAPAAAPSQNRVDVAGTGSSRRGKRKRVAAPHSACPEDVCSRDGRRRGGVMSTYYQSVSDIDAGDVCGCCSAGCTADDVQLAIDGNADALGRLSTERLQSALDALDACRTGECRSHGNERWARRLLDALIDQRESDDENAMNGCPACGQSLGCSQCLG